MVPPLQNSCTVELKIWTMSSLVSPLSLLVLVLLQPSTSMQLGNKDFHLYRLSDMDDKMPPVNPISPINLKIDCAMLCVADVTCAAFSYGEYIKFCMMMPEAVRPYDVSISLFLPGFSHFNVYEDIQDTYLPAGYRTFSVSNLAIRFHYYFPKSWEDASADCAGEGGRLMTLDTEEKRILLEKLISENTVLNTTGLGLYVGGKFNETTSSFFWENGAELANTDALWATSAPTGSGNCTMLQRDEGYRLMDVDCASEEAYICEHLHFETANPVPFWGQFSL